MGKRTIVLVVALLLAGLSAFAIYTFLDRVEQDAEESVATVTVYRAIEFIPRGVQGDDFLDSFEESTALEDSLPAAAIRTAQALNTALIGRVSQGPISRGQVVTTDLWDDPLVETVGLAELIEPGMQALSIRPDEVRGVGGFIQPGDKINLIVSTTVDFSNTIQTLRSPAGRAVFFPGLQESLGITDEQMIDLADSLPAKVEITQYSAQNVEVLAVGDSARGVIVEPTVDPETGQVTEEGGVAIAGSQVITLEVNHAQAESIVYAYEYTNVWLTLAGPGFTPLPTLGTVLDDIIELPDEVIQAILDAGLIELEEPEETGGAEGAGGGG